MGKYLRTWKGPAQDRTALRSPALPVAPPPGGGPATGTPASRRLFTGSAGRGWARRLRESWGPGARSSDGSCSEPRGASFPSGASCRGWRPAIRRMLLSPRGPVRRPALSSKPRTARP